MRNKKYIIKNIIEQIEHYKRKITRIANYKRILTNLTNKKMIKIENHTFESNNIIYGLKASNFTNKNHAPYYLYAYNPYRFISGLFIIDKKKMILQGKTTSNQKIILRLQPIISLIIYK